MLRGSDGGVARWRRLILPAILAAVVIATVSCAGPVPRHDGPVTDHFDGRRFYNVPRVEKGFGEFLKWQFTRESQGTWRRDLAPVEAAPPPERVEADLRVTFINHATVLLQTHGMNLLTDPIWSERASPFTNAGPQRYRAPGLRFRDLPPIDFVLLSHNHYDHMDAFSLRLLAEDHDPLFVVPLGNCFYLRRFGADRCRELDWWQRVDDELPVSIRAVPVRHWSKRGLLDTNRALWAGYFIEAGRHRVYFAGDTGMGDHFSQVRERLGRPDLAILPIGAYLPRWFMSAQHIDPAEAVEAHRILGAPQSMAIHFGTFRLADDGQEQPARELLAALDAAAIPPSEFWIPDNGDSRQWPPHARR
ncbi:MAG: MBL fold metallo-hydrolase [Gammaproteobacteria bacterium]